jgi:hypothetical protein
MFINLHLATTDNEIFINKSHIVSILWNQHAHASGVIVGYGHDEVEWVVRETPEEILAKIEANT